MKNIVLRDPANPIMTPDSLQLTDPNMEIVCLLNPGAFVLDDRVALVLRVAIRPLSPPGFISILSSSEDGFQITRIPAEDKELDLTDPRVISYKGVDYLASLSYLQLVFSNDGIHFFTDSDYPVIYGNDCYSTYGIEDCRITQLEGTYFLTYTSVSPNGVCVAMKSTTDWKRFTDMGLILPPHNKDCALLPERIGEKYYILHRPSSLEIGGNYIWIAESEDLRHWGNHRCIARTRPNMWDCARIGAGAAPIKTEKGWLEIYHGADKNNRYCLGVMLLDLNDPSKVLARSTEPLMIPEMDYERIGFFGDVIFTNGQVIKGDTITFYYGASDEVICRATVSIQDILKTLL